MKMKGKKSCFLLATCLLLIASMAHAWAQNSAKWHLTYEVSVHSSEEDKNGKKYYIGHLFITPNELLYFEQVPDKEKIRYVLHKKSDSAWTEYSPTEIKLDDKDKANKGVQKYWKTHLDKEGVPLIHESGSVEKSYKDIRCRLATATYADETYHLLIAKDTIVEGGPWRFQYDGIWVLAATNSDSTWHFRFLQVEPVTEIPEIASLTSDWQAVPANTYSDYKEQYASLLAGEIGSKLYKKLKRYRKFMSDEDWEEIKRQLKDMKMHLIRDRAVVLLTGEKLANQVESWKTGD